jgi:hypothetical protein
VDSPTIIVEGDAESKMAGLTAKRREVIMDMEDFAETEVRARPVPRPRARARKPFASPVRTATPGRLFRSQIKRTPPRSVAVREDATPSASLSPFAVARARSPR